jgi:hypothetical protein
MIGKSNPPRKHLAQTISELLGSQALCMKNPFRESLILRMRYPKKRFIFQNESSSRLGGRLEVELLEDDQD